MPTEENKQGPVIFQWQIPEYLIHERTRYWYLVAILFGVTLIVYSIITANFLFALIIILVTFIIFLRSYAAPRNLIFQITDTGLVVGDRYFPYEKIKNFYFIYDPPAVKKLFFDFKGLYPTLSIPLDNNNPTVIRQKLLEYLIEDAERGHQSFDDQMETLLKL